MKRLIIVVLILAFILMLSGSEVPAQAKTKSFLYQQEIICVEGKKIWVAEIWSGRSSSLTSQIVGECPMEVEE